jgi:hypothetical protein
MEGQSILCAYWWLGGYEKMRFIRKKPLFWIFIFFLSIALIVGSTNFILFLMALIILIGIWTE